MARTVRLRRSRRRTSPTALAIFAFGTLAAVAQPADVLISVTQLDWLEDDHQVLVPSSRVGRATFTLQGDPQPFLIDSGGSYVNVVTDAGAGPRWSVRNLLLVYPDEPSLRAARPSVLFELPATGRLDGIDLGVTVGPQPQSEMPLVPVRPHPILHRGHRTGGRGGGGSELSNLPLRIGPWSGPLVFFPIDRISTVQVPVDQLPAVAEDDNGCAPGGVARSIAYMSSLFDLGVDDAGLVYLDLYSLMGTSLDDGTSDAATLFGKNAYTDFAELPIDSQLVDWPDGVDDAMDTLDRGGDVEVRITWDEVDEDDWLDWLDELLEDEEKKDSALQKAGEEDPNVEELLDQILERQEQAEAELERILDEILGRDEPRRPKPVDDLADALDEALGESKQAEDDEEEFWEALWELMFDGPGGHVAMVTSVVRLADGSLLLTYVDDPEQGDGEAENVENTLLVRPDGTFDGGRIDGFLIENVVL